MKFGRHTVGLAVVWALAVGIPPASAYFAGGGKKPENDCLIGYQVDPEAVVQDGKRFLVECTDCDPACDLDGVDTANGSCTFRVGVCINQGGVAQCTPASGLDKAKARVKGGGGVVVDVPELLQGSACGALVDLAVGTKKSGKKPGKATFSLSAQVKPEGEKKRKDGDKLVYVCNPRPEGEACPSGPTTSTSLVPTTVTTTITSTTSSTTTSVTETTSTTVSTTTSTSEISTTSTSTSSTTTTSEPGATTTTSTTSSTATSEPVTTTSTTVSPTSSTSTSSSTSTTTSTTIPALCGNGVLNAGETCDDGNNSDNDGCPADCLIAPCTPLVGTVRPVTVSFAAPPNVDVAALTLLLNYPEEKVFIPPGGPSLQISATYFVPSYPSAQVLIRGADLAPAGSTGSGHAVRGLMAASAAVPHGSIFQLKFQDCEGAAAPVAGEFNCTVLDASDPFSNPLGNVTCNASIP